MRLPSMLAVTLTLLATTSASALEPTGASHTDNWPKEYAASTTATGATLEIGGVDYTISSHSGELNRKMSVQGYSWGPTRPVGYQPQPRFVTFFDKDNPTDTPPEVSKGGWVLDQSTAQNTKRTPPTVTLKRGKNNSMETGGDPDRPVIAGRVPNPSAERPLARGSLTVRASGLERCVVGMRYPNLTFSIPEQTYRLSGVTVAGCGAARSGGTIEHISYNYDLLEFL